MKKHKIGTTILLALAPASALGVTVGVVASLLPKRQNIEVEKRTIESKDSVASYKFNMVNKPDDNQVHISLNNKAQKALDHVVLYSTNSSNATPSTEGDVVVKDDGSFELPIGLFMATPTSSTSPFDIEMTYTLNGEQVTQTISNCNLEYKVSYSGDIKDGTYNPQYPVDIPSSSHWTSGQEGAIYLDDILANPSIYEEDARYSTSKRIKAAIDADPTSFKVKSFAAAFNDVVLEQNGQSSDGVHVHMNYQIDGTGNDSVLKFTTGTDTYTFTNFNCSFTWETNTGYNFQKVTSVGDKMYQIIDNTTPTTQAYALDGRFKGSFTYSVSSSETGETITGTVSNYDGTIYNYGPSTSDQFYALMFASGIIHLTYDFDWSTITPRLTILSPYSVNAN